MVIDGGWGGWLGGGWVVAGWVAGWWGGGVNKDKRQAKYTIMHNPSIRWPI